jgi:hypothetical protein
MLNEADYKKIEQKLEVLKEVINSSNSNVVTLINLSARAELMLRDKNSTPEEVKSLAKGIDDIIKNIK